MSTRESDRASIASTYLRVVSENQVLLILAITFTGMLEAALAPALPAIASALDVSDSRVGLIITAFKVPSILVIPVAAVVADRYGRRVVLLPSLLLFGLAGTLMVVLEAFVLLLAFAFAMGVGAAVIFPITVTMLGDICTGPENAAAQGVRVGIVGIGAITIPAASGYLSGVSWNYPFLLFTVAFPILFVTYLFLDETIEPSASGSGTRSILSQYGGAIRTELFDRNVRVLVAGGFVRGFVRYAVLTFIPLFAVRTLDASLFEAGALLSVRGLAYVFVSPLSGIVVQQVGRKRALMAAMTTSIGALVLIPFAPDLLVLSVVVVAYFVGDALFDPVMKDTVTTIGDPQYLAGVVNTLYALKRAGQTVSPALFGLVLAALGYDAVFVLAAVVVFVYLLVFGSRFSVEDGSTG